VVELVQSGNFQMHGGEDMTAQGIAGTDFWNIAVAARRP
jgi:hypothetical protein